MLKGYEKELFIFYNYSVYVNRCGGEPINPINAKKSQPLFLYLEHPASSTHLRFFILRNDTAPTRKSQVVSHPGKLMIQLLTSGPVPFWRNCDMARG